MVRVLLVLLSVGLTIYALVDCWRSTDSEVRALPRPLWFLVALIPIVGGALWLMYGRPTAASSAAAGERRSGPAPTAPRRVVAPDDDPEFLSSLEQRARQARREAVREQRRREKEAEKAERAEREARRKQAPSTDGAKTEGGAGTKDADDGEEPTPR